MIIVLLILVAMLVYLLKDNEVSLERNTHDPVQRTWERGWGGLTIVVIVLILFFSVIPFAMTGVQTNIGRNPDGSFTMHEPPDPNNSLNRPIGELMGLHEDAQGHWTR